MAVQLKQRMSVSEFDQWVQEQAESYEYIGGEALPVVSNNYASMIAARVLTFLGMYLLEHDNGYLTGSDGGYFVNGERYIPDVGFIRKERQPEPSHDAYNPNAPDLAVEVVSPTDKERLLLIKVSNYLAAGTTVWIVYPPEREVHIYVPGQGATILDASATLTSDLLPGFTLAVQDIFPSEGSAS